MTAPAQLLEEAGRTLARAEALIGRAGEDLGGPFADPLRVLAEDAARLRRKLRTATTTATTRGSSDG